MPRQAARHTLYDVLDQKGYFDSNPANPASLGSDGSSIYQKQEFPRLVYHPRGQTSADSPRGGGPDPLRPEGIRAADGGDSSGGQERRGASPGPCGRLAPPARGGNACGGRGRPGDDGGGSADSGHVGFAGGHAGRACGLAGKARAAGRGAHPHGATLRPTVQHQRPSPGVSPSAAKPQPVGRRGLQRDWCFWHWADPSCHGPFCRPNPVGAHC